MVHTIDSAPASAVKNGSEFSLVSHKTLLALYDAMLRARVLDEYLLKQARKKGLSALYASARGQEGAVAAVTIALGTRDFLAPSRHYLVPSLIRTRSSKGNSLAVRLSRSVPALPFQATLGFALEQARGQKSRVTAFFCSAYELSRPAARAFLHQAGDERLPLLVVAHGSRPAAEQKAAVRPSNSGFPAIAVDSHDAVGVYRVACEAIAHARRGSGPTLIHCVPSPFPQMGGRRSCPLVKMERYLAGRKLIPDGWASKLARRYSRELESALAVAQRRDSSC
jgi:Dehydrogenase E1 component